MPSVYFLRPVDAEGPVKIGCSIAPIERLYTYLPWSPIPLELVAHLPGHYELEARFHGRFIAQRLHHEWFSASPELTATIDAVRAGTFDVETLPTGPRKGWGGPKKLWTMQARLGASMSRRLEKLRRLGVDVPEPVRLAMARWGAGRYSPHYNRKTPYDRADAKLVCAFLTENGETPPLAKVA